MVCITDKYNCSGCGACVDCCPKDAIELIEDKEGFLYPHVDDSRCVHCGKCEVICPINHNRSRVKDGLPKWIPKYFAGQLLKREDLSEVSSGGAFWAFAQTVIQEKGVVYGAMQNGVDIVCHIRAETLEEAAQLRRSKYLPSSMTGVYRAVRKDLQDGRQVLFSGTGCQVAGLVSFLEKSYKNLTTCDVVCHGIPSLAVWRAYRSEHERKVGKRMTGLVFRNKSAGWRNNQYRIEYDDGSIVTEPSTKQDFHEGYLAGLFYRPSCGRCPFAVLPRVADITLADYWKYQGELASDLAGLGVSLISVNSLNGAILLEKARQFMHVEPTSSQKALASCWHMAHAPAESSNRSQFFQDFYAKGYYEAFIRNRIVSNRTRFSLCDKWLNRIRTIRGGLRHRDIIPFETLSLLSDYCHELGLIPCIPMSFWGSLQLLFKHTTNTIVLSRNEWDKRLACHFGVQLSNWDSMATQANHYFAIKETLELLAAKGVPVYFINRVGREKDPSWRYADSATCRMENGLDFPTMHDAPDLYESDLRELFGEKYSPEYIKAISCIPQIVRTGNSYRHLDCKSDFINIVGGRRITCYQPGNFSRTLHIYGRCGAFGYAVEDAETLPSQIQRELLQSGHSDIRVINHGLWGADDCLIDENFMRDATGMGPNDIVLFYRKHFDKSLIPKLEDVGLHYFDITKEWHQAPEAKWCFYDRPGHMNRIGYQIAARIIVSHLVETGFRCRPILQKQTAELKTPHLTNFLKSRSNETFLHDIKDYVDGILATHPRHKGETCGAIVMNCNPFTKGHRYLIEYAAGKVDRLYIFVVEEDKSFFRFKDRLLMVEVGTHDLPNVIVIPSGNFIISSLTFPEYFMKDYVKEKNFDVSSDVRTFCEYIAPPLGITVRFVGEELTDPVTANYNRCMHELLPQYGMKLYEIPRLRKEDNTVVSATEVRNLLTAGDLLKLQALVPESTLQIIRERYCNNISEKTK